MDSFEHVTPLLAPSHASFSLSKAFHIKHQCWVLLLSHPCGSLEEANQLLKTALHLKRTLAFSQFPPFLASAPAVTVTCVWEFPGPSPLPTWEASWLPGNSGYQLKQLKWALRTVKLTEAISAHLSAPVFLKTYKHLTVDEVNFRLNEAFLLAELSHTYICRIVDLCLYSSKSTEMKISVAFEKLEADLKIDIEKRRLSFNQYEEWELWEMLEQTATGLAHAKSLVNTRQKIAHRDIQPANILTNETRHLKIFGFQLNSPTAGAKMAEEQVAYQSPEARSYFLGLQSSYDPFKADIYSLGLTFLQLASLHPPPAPPQQIPIEIDALHYSQAFKDLLLAMLREQPHHRPTVEVMLPIVKKEVQATHPSQPSTEDLMPPIAKQEVQVNHPTQPSTEDPLLPESRSLVYLEESRVKSFDFTTKIWTTTELTTFIQVDGSSRYVWVEMGLFCSGGRTYLGWEEKGKQAYLLVRDWDVVSIAEMQLPRSAHGLWWHSSGNSVLVFGGLNSKAY